MGLLDWFRRGKASTIPDELWTTTIAALPFLAALAVDEQKSLKSLAEDFLAEKEFSAGGGLELSDEICVSIAAQGCLPILELGLTAYRGWVGIVVYPGDFVIPRSIIDEDGVVHEYDDPVLGEAWEGGPVLVAWFEDGEEIDGVNVVIHEFAHKLDMENGAIDGIPRLPDDMTRSTWIDAFTNAFEDFQHRIDAGEDPLLDPYAATDAAEFFAVTSEAFFQAPRLLRHAYPAVYAQLKRFYRQEPLG